DKREKVIQAGPLAASVQQGPPWTLPSAWHECLATRWELRGQAIAWFHARVAGHPLLPPDTHASRAIHDAHVPPQRHPATDCAHAWGFPRFDRQPALLGSRVKRRRNPPAPARSATVVITQEAVMVDNARSSAGVRTSVAAELDWDPKVDSQDIKVTADGGGVTLRGTVGSLRHVSEAQHAAHRVYGVTSVANLLTVRPMIAGHGEDREVRTAVLHALLLDSSVPATIDAQVSNGVVRLAGTATWNWQRDEAERVCAAVAGVLSVTNDITLMPAPADADIQQAIMAAFRRSGRLI